jgi:dTDP-4-amino-4,6-dideoxy-D-galactose acyltransferase
MWCGIMTAPEPAAVPPGCRMLEWDSEFFGIAIARIEPAALLDSGRAVMDWCEAAVDCSYLLTKVADQPAIDAAQAHGFRLIDVRLTLEMSLAGRDRFEVPPHVVVRPAAARDLERLQAIARVSHRDTRFYIDRRFNRARCDAMYDVWITKSCSGWADHVVVADVGGEAAGYVTCHRRGDAGEIGLVGVAEAHRGAGLGMAMTLAALHWFHQNGVATVSVVTQGRNAAGLRLYQRAGFAIRDIELSFHKWCRAQ